MDEARIKLAVWEAIMESQKTEGDKISVKTVLDAIVAGITEYDWLKDMECKRTN